MESLKQTRKNQNLTLVQVSQLTGISICNLSLYERRRQRPTEKIRNRIEHGLNLIIDWEPEFKLHTIKDAKLALHQLVKCTSGLLDDEEHSQMIDAIVEQVQILKLLRKPKAPIVYGQVFTTELKKKLMRTRYNGDNITGNSSKPIYL